LACWFHLNECLLSLPFFDIFHHFLELSDPITPPPLQLIKSRQPVERCNCSQCHATPIFHCVSTCCISTYYPFRTHLRTTQIDSSNLADFNTRPTWLDAWSGILNNGWITWKSLVVALMRIGTGRKCEELVSYRDILPLS
jgi:hypothetical protein